MHRATFLVLMVGMAVGCSRRRIVVGTKNFTEQVILGEIVAQLLEQRLHVEVNRKFNLGGTLLAHEALKNGSIDLYPEYTGTALTAVLHRPAVSDAKAAFEQVRREYEAWGLEWLQPLGFDNSFAIATRADIAGPEHLRTLSDAARRREPWRLGVGYEFTQRQDGFAGLVRTYGLRVAGEPVAMDLGLLYQALASKKVDMAAGSATDGMLARPEFVVLEDDRRYFPAYECALVVNRRATERFPGMKPVLAALSGRISAADMRAMNGSVDVQHRPAQDVAAEFLRRMR